MMELRLFFEVRIALKQTAVHWVEEGALLISQTFPL